MTVKNQSGTAINYMHVESGIDKLAELTAWFPLEDHELRKAGGNKELIYVSSEAITRRINSVFGFDWESVCRSYSYAETEGKWQATAHVDITVWLGFGTRTHSGIGAGVGTDLDMVVKTALVEGKKKAFYEFGGCGYLWDDRNCNRIKACLKGDPDELWTILDIYEVDVPKDPKDASIEDLIDLVFAIRT